MVGCKQEQPAIQAGFVAGRADSLVNLSSWTAGRAAEQGGVVKMARYKQTRGSGHTFGGSLALLVVVGTLLHGVT